eukprot:1114244-Prorocentrum_minimum.AAC.1
MVDSPLAPGDSPLASVDSLLPYSTYTHRYSHVGWLLVRKGDEIRDAGRKVHMEDVYADGVVMFQHRRYFLVSSALCFGLPTLIGTCFAVAVRCRCICSCRCCKHGLTSRAMSTTNGVRRGSGGGQEG